MKPKFSIGQVVYVKNPDHVYGQHDIQLEFTFQPYKIYSITQYGVGTDNPFYRYTIYWKHNQWKTSENYLHEDDLTDDVNDIFIMVHERMKQHLDYLQVAY